MQESKLTPVFKGEEKQGLDIINFNQSQLHLPGRLCRTGIFLLTVSPWQVTDGVFKAPGRGTARLSSCFPLSGESCLRPKYHTYILVLFYLQHREGLHFDLRLSQPAIATPSHQPASRAAA